MYNGSYVSRTKIDPIQTRIEDYSTLNLARKILEMINKYM